MASDYGDDAGEKLFDWMARIGQDAGANAMENAADKFATALHHAKSGETDAHEVASDKGHEWAKLNMAEFKEIDGYPELKDILSTKLKTAGVEHTYFADPQSKREYLLFKVEDAPTLAQAFDELIETVDKTKTDVRESLNQVRGKTRDERPLDERAVEARKASAALEAERGGTKARTHEPRFQENRGK